MGKHTARPTRQQVRQILTAHPAMDAVHIAQAVGVSIYHVRQCLLSNNRRIVRRAERMRKVLDADTLRRFVDGQLRVREIAVRLGVSKPVVERALRALNLKSKRGRGSPMESNYFWNGGRCVDEDGYILVKSPGHPYATKAGYVREHRLVMEKKLGRYLLPSEVVHHRNRNRADNRPGNLRVFATNATHLRHELTGKCPKWTPDGLRRIQEGNRRKHLRQRCSASRKASESDAAS